ncbi:MAG: type II secretion system secretin GspD [Desulfosalsimonadaceae bacterium]
MEWRFIYRVLVGLMFFILLGALSPGMAAAQSAGSDAEVPGVEDLVPEDNDTLERRVSIDFNDVDINVFIKFISELTGKNFIVDQRVNGKITIISPSKISVHEAYRVFESVLEVHGFTTVEAGDVIKVIPSPHARTMSIETLLREEAESPNDRIVTQLIPLQYADPDEIKQLFAPLVSRNAVILAYKPTNTLIITDVHSNIVRLNGILDTIDVEGIGREVTMISLQHSDSNEVVGIIDALFNAQAQPGRREGAQPAITAVPEERTNSIILQASETDVSRIRQLVKMIDQEIPRGQENINVYYLETAKAEDLVAVLKELPSSTGATEGEAGKKTAPLVSENVGITAHVPTNSLIIRADKDDYDILKGVIEKLDISRPMVYIEVLIMEVSKDRSFRLGAEWIAGGEASVEGREGVYGSGFSGGALGGDRGFNYTVPSGVPNSILLPPGFSMGVFGENIDIGGVRFPTISAVIQAYHKDRDVHILSTPQLLTTDNETARITVGRNIPYLTRAATGETNFSNYEYKDVGIALEITPQINKDRKIRLEIDQEITKLETTTDQFQPTTLQRSIQTTIEVNDRNTVVLGGLIDQSLSSTEYRVPCLGSIPGLGWLFKSRADANDETNLFIFLTPQVLENDAEAAVLHDRKIDRFEKKIEGSIKLYDGPGKNEDIRTLEDEER